MAAYIETTRASSRRDKEEEYRAARREKQAEKEGRTTKRGDEEVQSTSQE